MKKIKQCESIDCIDSAILIFYLLSIKVGNRFVIKNINYFLTEVEQIIEEPVKNGQQIFISGEKVILCQ